MVKNFDCIIIGSGAGGGTVAHALASTGLKILILERGGFLPREKENWNTQEVFLKGRYTTKEVWKTPEGKPIHPGAHYYVGGNTKLYGAALLRLREKDFQGVEHFEGKSHPWPLSYHDFQPYYLQAEKLYHVHGERGIDPLEPSEKEPFPYPAISHESRILELYEKMTKKGLKPFPLPLGLLLDEKNRETSPCIRCDTCDGFPCLVHAKADAETICIRPILSYPNVTLITHAKALSLRTDPSGKKVMSVSVERGGKEEIYAAGTFILSAGAINSAALLLRSKTEKHPRGLANSSDLVGRNYMCHINSALVAISKTPNLTHYEKTFALNDFYYGSKEWPYPMGQIQLLGNVKSDMLKGDAPWGVPDMVFKKIERHTVGWWITTEDLADPENRVQVTDQGELQLRCEQKNQEPHRRLVKKLKEILTSLDETFFPNTVCIAKQMTVEAVAHQVGTCRFGTDPETSVLDTNCKAHDVENLYVVDGSFFPSSGAVNPGLTIIANALRVADHLKNQKR